MESSLYLEHMKIVRRTVHRRITEEEMLRLKGLEPFSTFRQDSKPINFGFIFGMSYIKFSKSVLETEWKHERILQFIQEKGISADVEKMAEKYDTLEPKLWDYYAVSNYLRSQFFGTYPGLMERIKRNERFAKENGYIRSFHGAIRRVPMLMLSVDGDKQRPDENKKEIANLINICSNSTIQTDEVVTVMRSINTWTEKDDARALVHGTVHDSIDFYVEKGVDAIPVLMEIKEIFETQEEWQKGLMFPVDITICDIEKGDYYKHGTPIEKFIEQLEAA